MKYEILNAGKMSKRIRERLNISQKKLAEELGIARGYLSVIETGSKKPSFRLCMKIRMLYMKHCLFNKPKPLVEVMTPEQSKKPLFQRIIGWFKK